MNVVGPVIPAIDNWIGPTDQIPQVELRQSSGYELFDNEVIELLQNIQPMPGLTESLVDRNVRLTLPIQFALRYARLRQEPAYARESSSHASFSRANECSSPYWRPHVAPSSD